MARIVFLYSSINGFVLSTLRELQASGECESIDLVHWPFGATLGNRYLIESVPSVKFHSRDKFEKESLLKFLEDTSPDIIYVSGWMDSAYLYSVKKYRSTDVCFPITVCGIDDQWKGSLRQYVGRIYFRLFYRKLFDFMWVSGKPQYHYAQRFGYAHENIISNLLSSDISVFNKKTDVSRRFVFVGRFAPVKGLNVLLDAYESLPESIRDQWPLVLIGDGVLRQEVEKRASAQIIVKPFLQPTELMEDLMQGGVACVPSYYEPWGVVIHEMALLGYPLILSAACGAATEFLISGYNGFLFRSNDVESLRGALLKITTLSNEQLERFSNNSHLLGQRITPEQAAYSLLSVLLLSRL